MGIKVSVRKVVGIVTNTVHILTNLRCCEEIATHPFVCLCSSMCSSVFACERDLASFSHKFTGDSKKIGPALNLALNDLIVTMVMSTQTAATSVIKVLFYFNFIYLFLVPVLFKYPSQHKSSSSVWDDHTFNKLL